jgi:hypothetical protein
MNDMPPFSRRLAVSDVPPNGTWMNISAGEGERAALARDMDLPEVRRLEARLHAKPWGRSGLRITGEVEADIVQICGVTLEPFSAEVREEVDVRLVDAADLPKVEEVSGAEHEADLDAPDVLDNGGVDLGALAAEHLALGMDPYPRSPAADAAEPVAAEEAPAAETHRPFAGLGGLLNKRDGD